MSYDPEFYFNNGTDISGDSGLNQTSPTNAIPKVRQMELNDYLWIYVSPVIFIVGVCGNSLTLAVMAQKRLRGTTTSVYMPVIAMFDNLALFTGILPEWLEFSRILSFSKLHPWTCKLEKFSFYTLSDVAIWTLVLFTLDRLIAVRFPLKKSVVCVPKRAIAACVSVLGLCALKNFHVFWTRGAQYNEEGVLVSNCGRPYPYAYFELHVRPWIALALVNAVPFVILLASNSVIIWTLAIVRRTSLDKSGGKSKTFNQTTMMCLSVSFAFLIFVTPSMVTLIGRPYWSSQPNLAYDIAKAINNQLAYLNHAINFFLYCMTGQKFRNELISLLCRRRRKTAPDEQTWQTYVSDGRTRPPLRKGVIRGLDSVKNPAIQPLAPAAVCPMETEI